MFVKQGVSAFDAVRSQAPAARHEIQIGVHFIVDGNEIIGASVNTEPAAWHDAAVRFRRRKQREYDKSKSLGDAVYV